MIRLMTPHADIIIQPNQGMIYAEPADHFIEEHGGFTDDDTHVALLMSLPGMPPQQIRSFVRTAPNCTYDSESNWPRPQGPPVGCERAHPIAPGMGSHSTSSLLTKAKNWAPNRGSNAYSTSTRYSPAGRCATRNSPLPSVVARVHLRRSAPAPQHQPVRPHPRLRQNH